MKFYELVPMIADNEFTLHVSSDGMKDYFRVYKDDCLEEFLWEFGYADVLGISTKYGDLDIYASQSVPCVGLEYELNYYIVGTAERGKFILDEAQTHEEAKRKAEAYAKSDSKIRVTIEEA